MIIKILKPCWTEVSDELYEVIEKYFSDGRLICCQDIQEATEVGTKISNEADALRKEHGQFLFMTDESGAFS
jgi:hypothetical protein